MNRYSYDGGMGFRDGYIMAYGVLRLRMLGCVGIGGDCCADSPPA